MTDDKLHPLRTHDGRWHTAASHDNDPLEFRKRMDQYRDKVAAEAKVAATVTPLVNHRRK